MVGHRRHRGGCLGLNSFGEEEETGVGGWVELVVVALGKGGGGWSGPGIVKLEGEGGS